MLCDSQSARLGCALHTTDGGDWKGQTSSLQQGQFSDFITPAGPLLAEERIFMRENAINLLSLKAIRHHVACS